MLFTIVVAAYLLATFGLSLYGFNKYYLLWVFRRVRRRADELTRKAPAYARLEREGCLPRVLTQIPLYNEINVAERCLRAVAAIRYPRELHTIQVLDDSTDETREIVERVSEELRGLGHDVEVVRRTHRTGFKAGALKEGLERVEADLVAIFDGDFVPPADFLERTVPALLAEPETGLVQARWGHLNREESLLTLAQSVGIDHHFVIEQTARSYSGLYMNFNGTAGLWRRAAIEAAGGWRADTLTEDLELSYRAQMAGWKLRFLPDLVVPAEIPASVTSFKSQQFRWAKGSMQTACLMLPKLWRRPSMSLRQKLQCTFHLTHYMIHPLIMTVALVSLPMAALVDLRSALHWAIVLAGAFFIASAAVAPTAVLIVSQRALGIPHWRTLARMPALMAIGMGIAVSNTRAVLEAWTGRKSAFVRTPKAGDRLIKRYAIRGRVLPLFEIALGLYSLVAFYYCVLSGNYPTVGFVGLYALGFLWVGIASFRSTVDPRGFLRCLRDWAQLRRCEPGARPAENVRPSEAPSR
jgi:cellulose synthase/poly-beta-1,6-N-acetylglucosamine synthase-like glycosyltransferase